jgi:putative transposase
MPSVPHCTLRYANNRAEVSHQRTRRRESQMRRFKSQGQAQRFLAVHSRITNLFAMGRHHLSAKNYRLLRDEAFATWREITAQAA